MPLQPSRVRALTSQRFVVPTLTGRYSTQFDGLMAATMLVQTLGGSSTTYINVPTSEILHALSRPLQPQFPLNSPLCRRCGWRPRYRCTVTGNQNGNVGRPYYICVRCDWNCSQGLQDHHKGWITWDDDRGIRGSNPRCYCGAASRQDRAGAESSMPGLGFWTCATRECDYFSKFQNGWTDKERALSLPNPQCVKFVPWLL